MSPLLVASLVVFLEGLSFGVILPVLQPFAERLGGTPTWAGILFAAATLPRVFTAPLWGRLSDRVGRRPTMTAVALGTASASVLWALSPSLDGVGMSALLWLLASRVVYGLFAAQSVLGMAVASDVSTPARRAAAMGALGAAFGLAFTIGPGIGGSFGQQFGHAAIGWLSGGFQLASALLIVLMLRETRPVKRVPSESSETGMFVSSRSLLHLAAVPAVSSLVIVTVVSTAAYSVLFPTFPELADGRYGWSTARVGWALSGFGLIGAIVQGGFIRPMVRRRGEKSVAVLGLACLGAGLLGLAAPTGMGLFFIALSAVAVGTGFCVPTITGMMSLSVPENEQGAVHGLNQSATSVGRTVGFALSGVLYEHAGASVAYAVAAAGAGVALLLISGAGDVRSRRDPIPEATADEIP